MHIHVSTANLKLSDKAITEFIHAYRIAFDVKLTKEEALAKATGLMHLVYLVYGGTKL